MIAAAAVAVGASWLGGCGGVRFIIDAVPAEDRITETVVREDPGLGWGRSKVALIDVNGLIVDARRPGLVSDEENPVARFSEALNRAERDRQARAVIVRVNSPGGGVTASDVMYGELMRFKQNTGKPVVVLMEDVAASGGLYLACAGDEIIARPTTVTGSIGVLIQTFNFAEGMSRIGIRGDAITSGPNKSMGSPFEPMPPEHRALLQGVVDEFYERFRSLVAESRPGLSEGDLEWVADGRIVTGTRAAEIALVDRTGDLDDAFGAAKRLAGLTTAALVKYHRPLEFVGSAYARAPLDAAPQVNLLQLNLQGPWHPNQPGFYYLWDPAVW